MDWLNGINPQAIAGFGATGIVVIAGILYALAFQHRFTNRMEQQGDKDVKRIEKLEGDLLAAQGETRNEREYAAMLRVQIIEAGGTPRARPTEQEIHQ